MLPPPTIAANLLVPSSLEALLSQSSGRHDNTARLQRLHAAALLECAISGYADLKIADIAERAKVSTASIYKTYRDRDALLVAAIETLFAILAGDVIEVPQDKDPMKRVEYLLMAHGEVYAQPLSTWLHRLYAALAWSGQTQLRSIGLRFFQGIDSFWCGFLNQLIEQGHLVAFEPQDIVPHLLGPIERVTIIRQLGCGDEDDRREQLAQVARHGAETLFKLWGHPSADKPVNAAVPMANDIIFDPALAQVASSVSASELVTPSAAARLSKKLAIKGRALTPMDTRDRLLLAAGTLCQELGYQKASMAEVAARAKVSTATMYKLYKDKADLFASALEAEFRLRVDFNEAMLPKEDAQGQIANALVVIALRAKNPEWIWMYNVMMASEISGTPRIIALTREHHVATEAFVRSVLTSSRASQSTKKIESEAEIALSINFLLGAVERHSVLSLILFGDEIIEAEQLERLAFVSTASYLRLLTKP